MSGFPSTYYLARHIAAGRDARGEAPPALAVLLVGIAGLALVAGGAVLAFIAFGVAVGAF